ncbi:MAG: hypothetical protein K6E20_01755 [Acholeplasmatales bacterium]|nr:hypothetical protein [Acholeplasmatales bacterium]
MKIKTLTILTGTALLASCALLTSCGDNPSSEIEFKKYSSTTTDEAFATAHSKYEAEIDLTAGYELTTYDYTSYETEGDTSYFRVRNSKSTSKYDATNLIYTVESEDSSTNKSDTSERSYTEKESKAIQKNGEKYDIIDNIAETYYQSEKGYEGLANPVLEKIRPTHYVDMYAGSSESTENYTVEKTYYCDSDVYTLVLKITSTSENEEAGIKFKETTSSEATFQFYVSDTEVFGKKLTEKEVTIEYTEGETSGKVTKKSTNASAFSVKIGAQSLSKIDTSKYIKLY